MLLLFFFLFFRFSFSLFCEDYFDLKNFWRLFFGSHFLLFVGGLVFPINCCCFFRIILLLLFFNLLSSSACYFFFVILFLLPGAYLVGFLWLFFLGKSLKGPPILVVVAVVYVSVTKYFSLQYFQFKILS